MPDETIARASIQLGADGSKLAPEMAAAVAKAQGQLTRANKRAERAQAQVARQIQSHIDRIKATRPTNEMRLLEQAVNKLGGTAKLKAGEIARLRTEVDRLAKAGAKVPKSLAGLRAGPGRGAAALGAAQAQLTTQLAPAGLAAPLAAIGPAGIAAAAGVGTAVAAVGGLVKVMGDLAERGSALTDLSQRTGFTTDALQKLEYASRQTGVAFEQTVTASRSLQRRLIDMPQHFEKLGLNVQRLISLEPDQAFAEVGAAIAKLPTQAERSAAAMNLLGDAGTQVLPLLLSDIAGAADEAERLGHVLSEEALRSADQLGDSLTKLDAAWDGFILRMAAAASGSENGANAIEGLAEWVGKLGQELSMGVTFWRQFAQEVRSFVPPQLGFGAVDPELQDALRRAEQLAKRTKERRPQEEFVGPVISQEELKRRGKERVAAEKEIERAQKAAAAAAKRYQEAIQSLADSLTNAGAQKAVDDLAEAFAKLTAGDLTADGLEKIVAALRKAKEQGAEIPPIFEGLSRAVDQVDSGASDFNATLQEMVDHVDSVSDEEWAALTAKISATVPEVKTITKETVDWRESLQNISTIVQGLPGSLQGVGRIISGIATGIAGIGSTLSQFGKGLKGGLSGLLGSFSQGFEGLLSGITGIGGLATSAIGIVSSLGSAIGGLFGGKSEVSKERDKFFAEFEDGFVGVQRALAGTIGAVEQQDFVQQIFDAKTVEEFNAAVQKTRGLLDTQTVAQEELNAALSKYGFHDQVSQAQELTDQGAQLFKEWKLLTEGGFIPAGEAIGAMGPNLLEFVNKSREAGQAIPEAMRPMIDQLIASGQLVDANGNAFSSAEEAGITFAQTMSEQFQTLISKLDEWLSALSGAQPAPINVPVNYTTSGLPPTGIPSGVHLPGSEIPGFAEGALVRRPTLAYVAEKEPELITPLSRLTPFGGTDTLLRAVQSGSSPGLSSELRGAGGRGRGGDTITTVNLNVDENPFQSAERQHQLRRHTLKIVEEETAKNLAALIRAGKA